MNTIGWIFSCVVGILAIINMIVGPFFIIYFYTQDYMISIFGLICIHLVDFIRLYFLESKGYKLGPSFRKE